jgi:hypothetical protein
MADKQDNVIPSLAAHTGTDAITDNTWVNTSTAGTLSSGSIDFSGSGISTGTSGDLLISGGSGVGWGTSDISLSNLTGPFSVQFLENGDLKIVLSVGDVDREFHVSVAKVLEVLYKSAHLIIEPPPEEDDA